MTRNHLPAGHHDASPIVSKAGSPRSASGSWSSETGRSGSTKSSSSIFGVPSITTVASGVVSTIMGASGVAVTSPADVSGDAEGASDGVIGELKVWDITLS